MVLALVEISSDYVDDDTFLGKGKKGIYVSDVGGLPLFASGSRLDARCTGSFLIFTEPCDPTHIRLADNKVFCVRSGYMVGEVNHDGTFKLFARNTRFFDVDSQWPPESQPENFWGSEGQYCAWNHHERSSRPLSY